MKRLISFFLAMVMLLVAGTALADDWYCPECGQKNSGNFCPNDGTKRPNDTGRGSVSSSKSNLKVDKVKLETDGSVTISWSGGKAPYKVLYQSYVNKDHNANANVILWLASGDIYETKKNYQTVFVPGAHYWIIVKDSENNEAWYDYSEYVAAFSRAECSYFFSLRTKRKNKSATVKFFSARTIQEEFSYHKFGATIKITPKVQQEMSFIARMAIKLPSGEQILFHREKVTFKPRNRGYAWFDYNFNEIWNKLMKYKSKILAGTYTFRLFFDNEYVFNKDFTVTN